MTDYPVQVQITPPLRLQRSQLVLRILLAIVLGWLGITAGWLVCLLFAVLPLIAAIAISSTGGIKYLTEVAPKLWRPIAWLLQLSAYMMLLDDTFPAGTASHPARIDIRYTGTPTMTSALARLVTSLPSGIVLCVLWFVSGVFWLIAAFLVLLGRTPPDWLSGFQIGVLRWQARLVAYHASLVEEYPPFELGGDYRQSGSLPHARAR
jgi:hypothetical protein